MSTTTGLTKWKHALIIALLVGGSSFLTSLTNSGLVATTVAGPIMALIGEALIYEHSE